MFFDNILFGVGRGGYPGLVEKYVGSGRINNVVSAHSYPHNLVAEQAVSFGLIGLSVMLLLIGYVFYIALNSLRMNGAESRNLVIIMVSFVIIGMFEGSITINGGYISFLLIYLGVSFGHAVKIDRL